MDGSPRNATGRVARLVHHARLFVTSRGNMLILAAIAIAVLGTVSRRVRRLVHPLVYWACVVVALLTAYGMTLT